MAAAASQVILHPLVSQTLKFGSTTLGRDKIYRAAQYFARFFAWYLLKQNRKFDAARWNALKSHLATARKLLRLGKPIEHLQAAIRTTLASGPAVEHILAVSRQLAYFGYLSYDALVWANNIKFVNLTSDTSQKVSRLSNRLWFAGILFSLLNGVLKAKRLSSEAKRLSNLQLWAEKDVGEEAQRVARLNAVETAEAAVRRQFVIDILDIWIPATGANIASFNDGILGIFGMITSVLGIQAQWRAVN